MLLLGERPPPEAAVDAGETVAVVAGRDSFRRAFLIRLMVRSMAAPINPARLLSICLMSPFSCARPLPTGRSVKTHFAGVNEIAGGRHIICRSAQIKRRSRFIQPL